MELTAITTIVGIQQMEVLQYGATQQIQLWDLSTVIHKEIANGTLLQFVEMFYQNAKQEHSN